MDVLVQPFEFETKFDDRILVQFSIIDALRSGALCSPWQNVYDRILVQCSIIDVLRSGHPAHSALVQQVRHEVQQGCQLLFKLTSTRRDA